MAKLRSLKTSFTGGEISPRLLGRGDLRAYDNGAAKLRNVFIHPTGGLSRRPGLRHVDTLAAKARLVAFEFNTEQVYLLAFRDLAMDVYKDDALVATVVTPWTEAQLGDISWTQSADTLLVVHPDVSPRKITRTSHTDWTLADWTFFTEGSRIYQPTHKFAADDVTITPSATTGSVTLTCSVDLFAAGHVGTRMRIANNEVEITAVSSATQATATVHQTLAGIGAVTDWEEQAFSAVRGWPNSCCYHQDRLVIGGSRDLPNRLWLSKSSDLFNFDLGEGLDDESIEFAILSDQVNAIRAVFSGRHLQVFTSGAEWMVTGSPLTPSSLELKRQTRIGSPVDRTVPPRDIDGATIFVPRDGAGLREFLFADVEQAYQANDLAMLAQHLVNLPIDQDYDNAGRLLHLVMADGSLSTVTVFRTEQVTAWSRQETDGAFRSVAVAGTVTYFVIERDGAFLLEAFDEGFQLDSGLEGADVTAKTTWSGLDHLEGKTVTVIADGAIKPPRVVSGGAISLDVAVNQIQVGLAFTHTVEPLPPASKEGGQGTRVRLVSATFRLRETTALRVDVGRGFFEVPFKRFGSGALDAPPQAFSGDKTIRAFGWHPAALTPLWRIEQDAPLPFTLLSVAAEIGVND